MELNLGAPGSSHFTPAADNQDTSNRDKRRKNPSTLCCDKKQLNKIVHRGQVHDLTLPVKFSMLSRDMSAQINTVMSPHTHPILPLVMTAKSKNESKINREKGGKGSRANNLYELDNYRTSPLACTVCFLLQKLKIKTHGQDQCFWSLRTGREQVHAFCIQRIIIFQIKMRK
jgi:hypothetical protein